MTDRIVIPEIPVLVHLGVPDVERAEAQEVFVELALLVDLRKAGRSDDLADSVDYEAVCRAVEQEAARGEHHLIESLAEALARRILDDFPVARVTVGVRKPGALRHRGIPFAAVEIVRGRDA